jgi:hypothetical protein
MMPASLPLLVLMMIPVTGIVAGVGLFIGWSTVTVLRTTADGIAVDSLLAPVAFWIAFWVAMVLPWHGSYVEAGWTHDNQFPHPMAWAVGAACVGPVVHQVVRHRRGKAV